MSSEVHTIDRLPKSTGAGSVHVGRLMRKCASCQQKADERKKKKLQRRADNSENIKSDTLAQDPGHGLIRQSLDPNSRGGHDFFSIPVQLQRKLAINEPGDRYELEAEHMADAVMAGRAAAPLLTASPSPSMQRQEPPGEKTNEEKGKEAIEKVLEAFKETKFAKNLIESVKQNPVVKGVTEAGEEFIATRYGRVITGAAATGVIAGMAATHTALPLQIPEIPLDFLIPGLSVTLIYKGPVDRPTEAMITFKFSEQASPGAKRSGTPAHDRSSPRPPLTFHEMAQQREAERRVERERQTPRRQVQLPDLDWEGAKNQRPRDGLELTPPTPSFGYRPRRTLGDEYRLQVSGREEEEPALQRKAVGDATVSTAPPIVHEVLASSGQPLDPGTRMVMEERFGYDFSRVRVHTDTKAAESARSVNALAYTVGPDIVFSRGLYDGGTQYHRIHLLAHELTHVVQQTQDGHTVSARDEQQFSNSPRINRSDYRCSSIPVKDYQQPILQRQLFTPQGPGGGFGGLMERDRDRVRHQPIQGVCGPDVTVQTSQALELTRRQFGPWSPGEKEGHCHTLTSPLSAGTAWDIDELHNHGWLNRYQPDCVIGGSAPPCFPSVWVNNGCYYPGSVNYALFGTMCKLCFDHLGDDAFTEKSMLSLIDAYKGPIPLIRSAAPNFRDSQLWAKAGYDGWPSSGSTPPPDRYHCQKCKLAYEDGRKPGRLQVSPEGVYQKIGTGEFSVHWGSDPIKTSRANRQGKSEGWFGGPTWIPNSKDYGFEK